MNLLTFDIEEWTIEKMYFGGRSKRIDCFDYHLNHILDLLDATNNSATFFCLGRIAKDYPYVIKAIASRGHEIGCHSDSHKWITTMRPDEFNEDTHAAVNSLENITGKKIESYRAPAFSIGESNLWAFDILARNGITNDASVFPGARDFGGFPSFTAQEPCKILYNGIVINEFPLKLYGVPFTGRKLAFSGGGYFRLMPLTFVKNRIAKSSYSMCYFHIDDLITERIPFLSNKEYEQFFHEYGSMVKRMARYFKSNIGRSTCLNRLDQLVESFNFVSIRQYLKRNEIIDSIQLEERTHHK